MSLVNLTFAREIGLARWFLRSVARQVDKRVLRRDRRIALPTGAEIILPRASHSASEVFVSNANIDWGAEAILARFAERSVDMFDVGSHIGYYALYIAPLARQVYAFEPDERNLPSLERNAALAGNVTVVRKAVSNKSGVVHFRKTGQSETGRVDDSGEEIAGVTIDDFVAQTGAAPALVKVDVEGHDLSVVEGASQVMCDLQPLFLIEFNRDEAAGNDAHRLFGMCTTRGYRVFASVWAEHRPLLARRQTRMVELDESLFEQFNTKMLFLVPPRLAGAFEALVAGDERAETARGAHPDSPPGTTP